MEISGDNAGKQKNGNGSTLAGPSTPSGSKSNNPSSSSNGTEKNSLAAVLSKLQQIKTQGSLNAVSSSGPNVLVDTDSGLNAVDLASNPPSQKISTSTDKSLYRFTFATPCSEFSLFANVPHSMNPVLLPDAPIKGSLASNKKDKPGAVCRVCRLGFQRIEERDKHLARKSVRITCGCCETCQNSSAVFYNKCAFYLHLIQEKIKSSTLQPVDLSKCVVNSLEPSDYPIITQEWYHALAKGAQKTEDLIREKIKQILDANNIWSETLPRDFCPVCEAKVSSVEEHLQTFVPLEEQNCGLCSKTSLINSCAFTAHQSLHVNPLSRVCPECGIYSESSDVFNRHLKKCHHFNKISGFRCIQCQLNFTKISLMVDHVAKKHSEFFYKCSKCTLAFKSETSAISHYANSHNQKVSSEFVQNLHHLYKCLICNELTMSEDKIKEHVSAQHVNLSRVRRFFYFRCPACSKVFESKSELITHITNAEDEVHKNWKSHDAVCDVCHKTFPRHIDMIAHREVNHSETLSKYCPAVPIQHDKGPKTGNASASNTVNVKEESPSSALNIAGGSDSQRLLVCPHPNCSNSGVQFLYAFQLEIHTAVHHSARVCQFCSATYHGSSSFEKHLLIDHGKGNVTDAFECIFCQSKFDNSVTRNHHVTLFHGWGQHIGGSMSGGSANGSCGIGTGSMSNIVSKLECKVCSVSFNFSSACRDHFALVHPSGFNFVCVNCPVSARSSAVSDPSVSADSSNEQSNFLTFDNVAEFKKHQLTEHDFAYPKPAKMGRIHLSNNDEKKEFHCFKGDYTCFDRSDFTWHIQKHFDKSQPWQCAECGFSMIQEAGLKSHLVTQHNISNYEQYKNAIMRRVSEPETPSAPRNKDESEKTQTKNAPTANSLSQANPLICAVCFMHFKDFSQYVMHRDSEH